MTVVALLLVDAGATGEGRSAALARRFAALRAAAGIDEVRIAHIAEDPPALLVAVRRAACGRDGAVVLHDAALPPPGAGLVADALAMLRDTACEAVVAAAQSTDTLKRAGPGDLIAATIDRAAVWEIRTPQVYGAAALAAALETVAPERLAQAARAGDHGFLPGLIAGAVRILPLPRDDGIASPTPPTTPAPLTP